MKTVSHLPDVLKRWNSTQVNYPLNKCVHELFETQVLLTPNELAIEASGVALSYRELNDRANQLARYLRGIGVTHESLVGVFLNRSIELVVGLLGILKAGGAYVPIDPSYPAERRSYMAEFSKIQVMLSHENLRSEASSGSYRTIFLDSDWPEISKVKTPQPEGGFDSRNLINVLFTSGSTGRPKGVMNIHRGYTNRLLWMQGAFELQTTDRVLQKTPIGFDVSGWEFFWPLICGAGLIMARPGGHLDTHYLIEVIRDKAITTMHFVPPMLQAFVTTRGFESCRTLRRVFCSGDILNPETQRLFLAALPECELHNLYGPTEASIDVTAWKCDANSELPTVPIGKPIANTQLYILDDKHQPVEIGEPGELYLAGVQLARGYLHRPDLTAERFVPNPWSDEIDAKMYKTGDLAKFMPDGNVNFLGRIDNQVKIRGVRIELGEVESALSGHHAVREAVVVAVETENGEKQLVAYYVSRSSDVLDKNTLIEHLIKSLPEPMIPSYFVRLSEIPLTANGKIDRKALPSPRIDQVKTSKLAKPSNEAEFRLAKIWSEVLRNEDFGMDDDFFRVGGDSILAIALTEKIREKLHPNFTVTDLYDNRSIVQIAKKIPEATQKKAADVQTQPKPDSRVEQSQGQTVVLNLFKYVLNSNPGSIGTLLELLHPNFQNHPNPVPGSGTGPASFRDFLSFYRSFMPDLGFAVEDSLSQGDKVFVRWNASGTHIGHFLEIKPSGRRIELKGILQARILDNRIVEIWEDWDWPTFTDTIGESAAALKNRIEANYPSVFSRSWWSDRNEPVFLVPHYFVPGWDTYEDLIAELKKNHTVATCELVGVRKAFINEAPKPNYSSQTEESALLQAMYNSGLEGPTTLIGWSHGGQLAMNLALHHPEAVKALVLIEPFLQWAVPEVELSAGEIEWINKMYETGGGENNFDRLLEHFYHLQILARGKEFFGSLPIRKMPQMKNLLAFNNQFEYRKRISMERLEDVNQLSKLEIPILVVTGTESVPLYKTIARKLKENIKQCQVVELPGHHGPHQYKGQAQFIQVFEQFLQSMKTHQMKASA